MLKMDCILSLQCIVRMDGLVKLWNITGQDNYNTTALIPTIDDSLLHPQNTVTCF